MLMNYRLLEFGSISTQVVKSHGRSIHKRSTLEILVKGKMLGEAAKRFSQPHRFDKFTYTTPAYCDYCSQVLWGFLKTDLTTCVEKEVLRLILS
jgi:myotubularin-related protein 5/13